MTIPQVLAFSLIHRPIYIFIPPFCLQSACHLLISCLSIIIRLTSHISLPRVFFLSTVLRVPTLDSGFVDVLLVLSIAISVANVIATQRARSLMSFHAYSCPFQYVLSRLHDNTPSTNRLMEFCNGSSFSTIHRLVSLLVGFYSCRNGKHGLVKRTQ